MRRKLYPFFGNAITFKTFKIKPKMHIHLLLLYVWFCVRAYVKISMYPIPLCEPIVKSTRKSKRCNAESRRIRQKNCNMPKRLVYSKKSKKKITNAYQSHSVQNYTLTKQLLQLIKAAVSAKDGKSSKRICMIRFFLAANPRQ